jgi:uncharacterized protein YcbX
MASEDARVTALGIAPVKGLRIAGVEQLVLEPGGARGDRRFYIVEERGWMVNGKHSGALNEIVAEVDAGERDGDAVDRLTLRFPDGTEVSCPARSSSARSWPRGSTASRARRACCADRSRRRCPSTPASSCGSCKPATAARRSTAARKAG